MNYLKQINAFWQWSLFNKLPNSAISLYFTILHLANCSFWKDEVKIPNTTIIAFSGFADNSALSKARKALVDSGLIRYKSGKINDAGTYELVKLYDDDTDSDTVSDTDSNTVSDTDSDTDRYTCSDTIYKQKENENNIKTKECVPARNEVKYSENVSMVVDEYNSLVAEYGEGETQRMIEILGAYKKSSGKTYKSDYGAIKKWVVSARNEEKSRAPATVVTSVYDDGDLDYDELERVMRSKMQT